MDNVDVALLRHSRSHCFVAGKNISKMASKDLMKYSQISITKTHNDLQNDDLFNFVKFHSEI